MKEIDARGLACPTPVLLTKAAIDEGVQDLKIIVDNGASAENVSLFLGFRKFEISVEEKGGDFYITAEGNATVPEEMPAAEKEAEETSKIMVMVAADRIGSGDDELGKKLMINFINTLKEMTPELWRLVFVNSGVKLAVEDSPVLPALRELEADGITILVCGTCLDHFKLLEKKQIGQTTNMLDIVTSMQLADKVINL